jgi:hypothetical protein
MRQLEPKSPPKHQVSWENVVHGLFEASSKTELKASIIIIIG